MEFENRIKINTVITVLTAVYYLVLGPVNSGDGSGCGRSLISKFRQYRRRMGS